MLFEFFLLTIAGNFSELIESPLLINDRVLILRVSLHSFVVLIRFFEFLFLIILQNNWLRRFIFLLNSRRCLSGKVLLRCFSLELFLLLRNWFIRRLFIVLLVNLFRFVVLVLVVLFVVILLFVVELFFAVIRLVF